MLQFHSSGAGHEFHPTASTQTRKASTILAAAVSVSLIALTVFFFFQYQNVIATYASQAQIMNQITLVKVEYNTSDPLTITGTHSPGSFQCNFTVMNPTNYSIGFLGIEAEYLRSGYPGLLYEIALGSNSGGTPMLNPGNSAFTVQLSYITYSELPPSTNTTPVFWVSIQLKREFSGRIVTADVTDSKITNEGAMARPLEDQTFDLLSTYSALAANVWIIGLSPVIIVGLAKSGKAKTDRLAALTFLLLAYFILCIFLLSKLPYPQPYQVSRFSLPATGGLAGLEIIISWTLMTGAGLSLLTAIGLFFHRPWAKYLAYTTGGLTVLSSLLLVPIGVGHPVLRASFTLIAITAFIAIIKLATSRDRSIFTSKPATNGRTEKAVMNATVRKPNHKNHQTPTFWLVGVKFYHKLHKFLARAIMMKSIKSRV